MTQTAQSARPDPEGGRAIAFEAADGMALGGCWFSPPAQPWGSVVLATGVGIPQRFYHHCARALARGGLGVLTFDYRGVGISRPAGRLRGFKANLLDWAQLDYAAALAEAARRVPHSARFVVGHSFGGQSLGLVPGAEALQGAIIAASASGDLRHWPASQRVRYTAQMALAVPVVTRALGHLPGRMMGGADLPPGVARQWARWTLTQGYLSGAVPERMRHASLKLPIFLYEPTDDRLGPRPAVDELASWYPRARLTRRRVSPDEIGVASIGHAGLFRPSAASLWQGWLSDLRATHPMQEEPPAG